MGTQSDQTWRVEGRRGRGFIISHGVCAEGDGPAGYVGVLLPMFSAWSEADESRLSEAAHKMAAAPDLLAALVEMTPRGLNSDNANIPDDLVIPVDMTMGEIRRAREAIARAAYQRGE